MNKIKQSIVSFIKGFSQKSLNTLIVLITLYVLINIISMKEDIVEKYYSRFLFKYISGALNFLSSSVLISMAEVLLIIFILSISITIIVFIVKSVRYIKQQALCFYLGRCLYKIMRFALVLYVSFMLLWGLNYYRVPLSSHFDSVSVNQENISKVAKMLIDESNSKRKDIEVDYTSYSIKSFIDLASSIEHDLPLIFSEFPFLEGFYYSSPKPIFMSKLFFSELVK